MPIRSRTHLVTFRLSSHEYEIVTRCCADAGARSVSDFVREAVLRRTSAHGNKGLLEADLITLTSELRHLDGKLKDLSEWITTITGDRNGSKSS